MAPPNNINISVIIPLYNEEKSLTPLLDSILKVLTSLGNPFEIILVDDGSADKTFELAKSHALIHPNLRIIKFRKNYGQTPAMVAGIDNAQGKILITMDGDLQNDPADIPLFIEKINEGYDIVVGWRHKRQDKFITRKIPSKIANWLIGKVTGIPIKDNGCSLKAYRDELIKNVSLYSEMHRFIPAMASIAGAKIAEIKVRHHPRKYGKSKYGLSRIYKVLIDLIAIKTIVSFSARPVIGFGIPAIMAAFLSLIIFSISILQAILNPEQSLVVIMGASMLFGALSIFLILSGLICELIFKTGNIKFQKLSQITAAGDFRRQNERMKVEICE